MEELTDFIHKLAISKARVLIITHSRADLDAIASAYLLIKYLKTSSESIICDLFCPDGISARTLNAIPEYLIDRIRYFSEPPEPEYDYYIFVDVGGESVLGSALDIFGFKGIKILIDHHIPNPRFQKLFDTCYVDCSRTSTLEIILDSILKLSKDFTSRLDVYERELFIKAIIVESKYLMLANAKTLHILSILLNGLDKRISDFTTGLSIEPDYSERVAVLKGFKRISIYKLGEEYLAAITHIGAYHNVISSKLISAGADLVIIYDYKKECKIHIRLSDKLHKASGVNVTADIIGIIRELYKDFDISGGGHSTIGNIVVRNVRGVKCIELINKIIESILDIFSERGFKRTLIE